MEKDELLFNTEWIKMFKTKIGFVYCERKGINSVASLVFKMVNSKPLFLLRYQPLPEVWFKKSDFDPYACCITGAIEDSEKPLSAAIREVFEESGIVVDENNLRAKSSFLGTTQSNEIITTYLFEVDEDAQHNNDNNDGSIFEINSYNKWVSENELLQILESEIHHSSLGIGYLLYKQNC